MDSISKRISEIGVVPVIKLSHPERDAAPLAKALTAGGVPVAEVTFRAAGRGHRHPCHEGDLPGHDCRRGHRAHHRAD